MNTSNRDEVLVSGHPDEFNNRWIIGWWTLLNDAKKIRARRQLARPDALEPVLNRKEVTHIRLGLKERLHCFDKLAQYKAWVTVSVEGSNFLKIQSMSSTKRICTWLVSFPKKKKKTDVKTKSLSSSKFQCVETKLHLLPGEHLAHMKKETLQFRKFGELAVGFNAHQGVGKE